MRAAGAVSLLALVGALNCTGAASSYASSCDKEVATHIRFPAHQACWTYRGPATLFIGKFSSGQTISAHMTGEAKGQLTGQANFLWSLVGKSELSGAVEATRKNLYQNSADFFAAQKDAYLAYLFRMIILPDETLSPGDKLKALAAFKSPPPTASSAPPPPAPAAPVCLPSTIVKTINPPNVSTLDGQDNVVGNISGIVITISQSCAGSINTYSYLMKYGYYNGSGTWRGSQNITLSFMATDGSVIQVDTFGLDRGHCVYGGPETRSTSSSLPGTAAQIANVDVSVSRVSSVQTGC
jgi:hypothetical protein